MRKAPPERTEPQEQSHLLRVIRAEPIEVVPRVTGYGTSQPARVWRAVSEVSGRVVAIHPDLRSGTLLPEGAELLRVDPTEYELSVAQLTSEIEQIDAELGELDTNEENLNATLAIEKASLALAETDLQVVRDALEKTAATQMEIDDREREVLGQRRIVQEIQNSIALVPAQRRTAQARRASREAQLAVAKYDLSKTVVHAPFACRVGDVNLQLRQFVQKNEKLFDASGIDQTEVEAQVRMGALRSLVETGQFEDIQVPNIDLAQLQEALNITAEVRLNMGMTTARWDATFDRVRENIDSQTHTAGVFVVVDRPYEKFIPGERPPLIEGAFCEVELRGQPTSPKIVVPRSAVIDAQVNVVNADGRLEQRPVSVGLEQSWYITIEKGLAAGDLVVVSDPVGVPIGSLIDAKIDAELGAQLVQDASGVSQ